MSTAKERFGIMDYQLQAVGIQTRAEYCNAQPNIECALDGDSFSSID
jgi:hypothetical protein